MGALEKVNLIKKIATELEEKFEYSLIEVFLREFGINYLRGEGHVADQIIEKLRDFEISELRRVNEELTIETLQLGAIPPKNWEGTQSVKAFISHRSEDKVRAETLRRILGASNIDCFVAHIDATPTTEWQDEIHKALNTMDFFIALHIQGFAKKVWCQQEIGFAVARNVKIISIKIDEDPQGFLGKYQALIRGTKTAEAISQDILNLLKDDPKTSELYQEKIKIDFIDEDIPF